MKVPWSRRRVVVSVVVVLLAGCFIALEVGLVLGPWSQLATLTRGMRLVAHGEYEGAIRDLARAVALRPDDASAHYYLGLAYAGIGQRDASLNHLQEAVRLDPGDARFHDALGRACRSAGATGCALREFEEAVRRSPRTPRYEVDLAGFLVDQGRWDEAAALLRQLERGEHEYRVVIRHADGTALGKLARQDLRATVPGTRP